MSFLEFRDLDDLTLEPSSDTNGTETSSNYGDFSARSYEGHNDTIWESNLDLNTLSNDRFVSDLRQEQHDDLPKRRAKRARTQAESCRSSGTDSSQDETDSHKTEAISPRRRRSCKRRLVRYPRIASFRSPSPFQKWKDSDEVETLSPCRSSEIVDHRSQSFGSEGPDSASHVDWDSFLNESSKILPASNFEKEFSVQQARMIDGGTGYKGLLYGNLGLQDDDAGSGENEPWYPYDPESIVPEWEPGKQEDHGAEYGEECKPICYGMIHKRGVRALPQGIEPLKTFQQVQSNSASLGSLYLFKFAREDGSFFLQSPPNANQARLLDEKIAVLNKRDTAILSEIASSCTFEAYSSSTEWISIANEITAIENTTHLEVDIVLYGPKKYIQDVGEILDNKKVFLQEPDYRNPSLDYSNPHFLDLSHVHPEPQMSVDQSRPFLRLDLDCEDDHIGKSAASQLLWKGRIARAFKNATRAQNLKRISADTRILTHLKPYQEEALDFIMQRESGPIAEDYCLWKKKTINDEAFFAHAITGCRKSQKPDETGGGILADEMGLGKTLTMLSAVIRTTGEAIAFASNIDHKIHLSTEQTRIPSRATLTVVPSPLLLNEWMQEIQLHCSGILNIKIYHGHGREGDARVLADSDIVLSTYHTIAHESHDKTSPLWQITWFRIVLDEAHIIRRMSTKLFKTIKKLHARFYWCLTGTPVQNSLDDLAALISFIRASPLDNIYEFRKHVIAPLIKGSENGVENLRHLLDSVCLRRTKELLNLPEVNSETQLLSFSSREEQQYRETTETLAKIINKNVLQPKNQKGYLGVFQLQLQLRRLCNHGTFQKLSLSANEFDPNQAISILKKQNHAKCEVCGAEITGIQGIEETRSGQFTVCGHLFCMKCVPKMKSALRAIDGRDGRFKCSLCLETVFGNYLIEGEESSHSSKSGRNHLSAWQYFDKDGCSTKISAIVADIENHKTEEKGIVFSCWTRSLDLVGIFLTSRKIPFVRMDGSHTLKQRKIILENYHKDPAVKILLMTTGTGAVGLNLAVANCVYLLEPQWNPMVENQAIARVLRLGQTRKVRVVRYIMKGTVEEAEMQKQQTKKLEFAKVGWKEGE